MKIQPMNDWVLVEIDSAPETIGSIIVLDTGTMHGIRTATVISAGPGRLLADVRVPMSIQPGERVCFHRWNLEHKSGQSMMHAMAELGPAFGLIKEGDVLMAWPADEPHEVAS